MRFGSQPREVAEYPGAALRGGSMDAMKEEQREEYSPLRQCKKSLQHLDELLPRFREMDEEVKSFRRALGNGEIKWPPPGKIAEADA